MRCFSFIFIILTVNISNAQDVIQKQNGVKINATVIANGLSSISYRLFNSIDSTIYTVPKVDLKRIIYTNGNTEVFVKSKTISKVSNNYDNGNGNYILKINPLSPLFGHMQLSFEHQRDKTSSMEYIVSLIGVGKNSRGPSIFSVNNGSALKIYKYQTGISFGVGYKYYLGSQENRINKVNSLASGFYIKPTAYLGGFKYNSYDITSNFIFLTVKNFSFFGAVLIEPGFQFIATKDLTVDIYAGLGYVFDNLDYQKSSYLDDGFGYGGAIGIGNSYMYSVLRMSEKSPGLAMTGGIKLGGTLNKKSSSKKK